MRQSLLTGLILALALPGCGGGTAQLSPTGTRIAFADADVFPESITSLKSGDLIVGSAGNGSVYRASRGSNVARVWIPSSRSGIREMLGVYADEAANTLYACSIAPEAPTEVAEELSGLVAFDLSSGEKKASYPLPHSAAALCNDIATDTSGAVYVSDTLSGRVLVLRPGARELAVLLADERLRGVNGIAVGTDDQVYVGNMSTGRLFRISLTSTGLARALVELTLSRPLDRPDGLRAIGSREFLLAENGGRVSRLKVQGNHATVVPLAEGAGWSGVTLADGQVWAVNPKAEYRLDPAYDVKDPNPFFVDALGPADRE